MNVTNYHILQQVRKVMKYLKPIKYIKNGLKYIINF